MTLFDEIFEIKTRRIDFVNGRVIFIHSSEEDVFKRVIRITTTAILTIPSLYNMLKI